MEKFKYKQKYRNFITYQKCPARILYLHAITDSDTKYALYKRGKRQYLSYSKNVVTIYMIGQKYLKRSIFSIKSLTQIEFAFSLLHMELEKMNI